MLTTNDCMFLCQMHVHFFATALSMAIHVDSDPICMIFHEIHTPHPQKLNIRDISDGRIFGLFFSAENWDGNTYLNLSKNASNLVLTEIRKTTNLLISKIWYFGKTFLLNILDSWGECWACSIQQNDLNVHNF